MDCGPPGSSVHGDSPGKNTGLGCHALLLEIFPTQGSNPRLLCLLHCRRILYLLSHQGSLMHRGLEGRGDHSSAQSSLFGIYMALIDVTLKGLVSGAEQSTTAPAEGTGLRG